MNPDSNFRKVLTFVDNLIQRSKSHIALRSPPPSYPYQPQQTEPSVCDSIGSPIPSAQLDEQFHVEIRNTEVFLGPVLAAAVTGVYDLGGPIAFDLTHAAMTLSREVYDRKRPPALEAAICSALNDILAMIKKQMEFGEPPAATYHNRRLASLIGDRICVSGDRGGEGLLSTFWKDQSDYVLALEHRRLLRLPTADLYSGKCSVHPVKGT
jgi:hypothetical protein